MRIWLHISLVLISCLLVYLRPGQPNSEAALQRKAQRLLDCYYGRGHAQVTVSLRQGHGERTVSDTQLGARGFVVQSQEKAEDYEKNPEQRAYSNHCRSEKLELPHKVTVTDQTEWVEHTDVAVVVDRDPGAEITPLLEAGLGLHKENGDQIQVVRAQR